MKPWVQEIGSKWRALAVLLAHKLRRVNERVDGYKLGGRTFESCRAHQPSLMIHAKVARRSFSKGGPFSR